MDILSLRCRLFGVSPSDVPRPDLSGTHTTPIGLKGVVHRSAPFLDLDPLECSRGWRTAPRYLHLSVPEPELWVTLVVLAQKNPVLGSSSVVFSNSSSILLFQSLPTSDTFNYIKSALLFEQSSNIALCL